MKWTEHEELEAIYSLLENGDSLSKAQINRVLELLLKWYLERTER